MITPIKEKLPNPDASDPQGTAFNNYIKKTGIETCKESALLHYTNVDTSSSPYVDSHKLNHCLTYLAYNNNNDYAQKAETMFGSDLDINDYKKSLLAMEDIFNNEGYSFSADSVIYKGVRVSFPYYGILDLDQCQTGDKIIFPGYLSTSVSSSKVKDFVSNVNGILLVISGLENAHCIVPDNSAIPGTKNSSTPEQEILLNKGTQLKVLDVDKSQPVIKIRCSVTTKQA